jgi:hypothetical protein
MTLMFINPGADGAVYLSQDLDHITVTFLPFVQNYTVESMEGTSFHNVYAQEGK